MKTKTTNRFVALVTAVLMLLTCVTFSPIIQKTAVAADGTYVLEAKDLTAFAAGAKSDGEAEKAGTDGFFTIYYSTKTKIDSSSKTFDDGYESGQRINSSAAASVGKDSIGFTVSGAATVKVWWVSNSDDASRQMVILNGNGDQVAITNNSVAKNGTAIDTLEISDAGTYYLGSTNGGNYIFKVEVTVAAVAQDYVFESKDLATFAAGAKADGDSEKVGTDGFFTLYYSTKTKVDTSSKTFDDGYESGVRLNSSAAASVGKDSIGFTVSGAATVKVWWVSNSDDASRQMVILNGNGDQVAITNNSVAKNGTAIDTLEISDAGTYYLGSTNGGNYIFKVQVTTGGGTVVRGDWADVAAPVISSAEQSGSNVTVTVTAEVGTNGGDKVTVTMLDKDGNEIESKNSLAEKSEHTLTFTPSASGTYTFKVVLLRDGEETEKTGADATVEYVLPLGKVNISSATSKGDGKIELVWSEVPEATGYNVYCDGTLVATADGTTYTVTGLTIGTKYSFTVEAVRGNDVGTISEALEATATAEAQTTWGHTIYGVSTDDKNNGYSGSANDDSVTVWSEGGKGKVVPGGLDGLSFYYATVPTSSNFTLRAKVHVDSWTYSNGQDGFGLLAIDSLPTYLDKAFWTNQMMLAVSKMEYYYDPEYGVVYDGTGSKYTMNLGVGVNTKLGITPENYDKVNALDTATIAAVTSKVQFTLDTTAVDMGLDAGTYNIVGNATNASALTGTIAEITDFILEIQKNNTGYFLTYYDENGNIIGQKKFYDPDDLSRLDTENVYVGFFAARNARATYTNIELTLIDPEDDAPAEDEPTDTVRPRVSINSASVANRDSYELRFTPNVDGKATVTVNGTDVKTVDVTADTRVDLAVSINSGSNKITVTLTPSSGADAVSADITVTYNTDFAGQNNLYVSPDGTKNGKGTPTSPLDIYTAVSVVQPGQTIVLMEGTYKLSSPVRIERGIDGAESANTIRSVGSDESAYANYIKMIADPEATSRPVFDFQGLSQGITHVGSYWYFQGFDVTNSADRQTGFLLSGNNNVVDNVNFYNNGNTGLQIARSTSSDATIKDWPSYNLILNCTSHNNADAGYEDADGFAAKLTCGVGNVFDGCVSYNNADDGWDLYARASTGNIGSVTIQNCVAYGNGYLEDGTVAGNGNGFKLGGENLPGGHKLINSVAFNNKANGITSNSCPDVIVENCTAYNNEGANITLYRSSNGDTDFATTGLISFKDSSAKSGQSEADAMKPSGSQDASKYIGNSNYYWSGSESANAAGDKITADMFVSLDFKGIKRNADGTIDLQTFLVLASNAPADAGARMSGQASVVFTITPDEIPDEVPDENPATGIDFGFVAGLIVLAGALAAVLVLKRKRA